MMTYSKFEGLQTGWAWLDGLLCRVFGHPQRSLYIYKPREVVVCARCLRPR